MSALSFDVTPGVDDSACAEMATWRTDSFGELAGPWARLAAHANPDRVRLFTIAAHREGALVAVGIVHVIRKLAIGDYAGGTLERLTNGARRIGWTPLAFDIGYLEIPFANRAGLVLAPDLDDDTRAAIWRGAVRAVDRCVRVDALCVKLVADPIATNALTPLAMAAVPFAETWRLTLPAALDHKRRANMRRDRRAFDAAGARLETVRDPASIASELGALFARTVANARARGDLPLPMSAGAALYEGLHAHLGDAASVSVVKIGEDIIAFALLLRSHDTLFMRFVGLDYERSRTSAAYFVLYQHVLETAAHEEKRFVDLGTGTDAVKRRLGAVPIATSYRIAFRRWLAPAGPLLTRMLAQRFRAENAPRGLDEDRR